MGGEPELGPSSIRVQSLVTVPCLSIMGSLVAREKVADMTCSFELRGRGLKLTMSLYKQTTCAYSNRQCMAAHVGVGRRCDADRNKHALTVQHLRSSLSQVSTHASYYRVQMCTLKRQTPEC